MKDWRESAACLDVSPHLFFPEDTPNPKVTAAQAKTVCDSCPVAKQCAALGKKERYGVWAGKTRQGRTDQRKAELP